MDEDLQQGIGRCGACDSTSSSLLKCSGCRLVSYCGTECQGTDWSKHKSICKEKRRAIQEVMLFEHQEGNHFGECPICFLPMPFDADKIMKATAEDEEHYRYLKEITATSCCSTLVCTNCFDAHIITCCNERIKPTCPFCRSETPDKEKDDYELLDVAEVDNHQMLIKNGATLCGRGDHAAAFTSYKLEYSESKQQRNDEQQLGQSNQLDGAGQRNTLDRKMNGQLCEAVIKRDKWVEHLKKKAEHTAKVTYNKERATMILNTTYKTAMEGNLIPDREALVTRIGNMIKSPNSNWSEKKPEWELPRTYFDAADKKAAKLGNIQGMYFVSTMLHCGIGVATNHGKANAYVIKAAAGGHPIARHEAGMYELYQGNAERAVRHFCIAASQGVTKSLEELKSGYKSGYVTKSEYEQALRSNQKAKEAMKDNEETRSQMLAETKRH
ncbi:hypothetical protein QTG54_002025 [Skeletonema marinoi]|uniref:MYND-type domain-containing protein n=1 Tax=Skeletonema marinoi TaxID=267567 RepID=A0AAD9DGB2_9STRA|nr:hypothetical protein QTG54_002025 [Skeletonema marinoi]